ncbi:MAG: 4-(cytidine 5'-diphospho)-2-C-methyl-D-erythritol kinase, partial [Pseudomonadota bacterium]
ADVPMCLHSRPLRARGIGDEITLLDNQKPLHLVLVNPGIEIATPEVFGKLSGKNNPAISETSVTHLPSITEISRMRNDLQAPAQLFQPVISEVLEGIASKGALVSRMSGSGATCFGVFETLEEATAACRTLKQEKPHWWCVATNTTVA